MGKWVMSKMVSELDQSCVDHLSTLSEIIDTRKQQGLSTYVAFIYFSKAYDRINRNIMWSKLERMGVAPKFTFATYGDLISILLDADDIALQAECESDLQQMLDRLHEWCSRWKLKVNVLKSQVMHFRRGPSVPRSLFKFMCGNNQLQIVDKYRYLGLIFTEYSSYDAMAKSVAQSATRALFLKHY